MDTSDIFREKAVDSYPYYESNPGDSHGSARKVCVGVCVSACLSTLKVELQFS
jgi:hypothetical protein